MFFDESRFGTHSRIGHGWFKRGIRTTVKFKLGYQNFYLYSGINHITGDIHNLIMPYVNTDCMNIYLENLSLEFEDKKIALIMDCAGWHKSNGLIVPENIQIIHLPPYSPELNPVERLWLHIKQNILTNKTFDTLQDLQNTLCDFIKLITPCDIKQICNVNYLSS